MALAMLAEQQEAGLEEAKGDSELTPVELQIPRPVWAPGGGLIPALSPGCPPGLGKETGG